VVEAAVVAFALVMALVAMPRTANAGTITAGEPAHSTADPKAIVFKVSVQAPAGLQSATLDYKLFNPDTTVGGSQPAEVSGATDDRQQNAPTSVEYTVVEGDSLWDVARRLYGDGPRYVEIFQANRDREMVRGERLTDPRLIRPGWVLSIPTASTNGTTTVNATVTLETNTATRYIPIGSRFTYTWTLVDKEGTRIVTPQREFIFLDGRYQWQEKTTGNFTVYWYGDNARNADLALQAAAAATTANETLLNVKLTYPIRLIVWRRESEGEAAQQSRGGAFDRQVITGGARVAPDVVHLYDPIGGFVDVVKHEVAHIVTKVAGDGPFGRLPSWIDEGTAVYAQSDPGAYRPAIEAAIHSDSLTRLRAMSSPSNQPSRVDTFYGQSWMTVKFMVEKYGQPKFAELYKAFKAGGDMDAALKQVYGVDQDGLYNQWRESVGLKAIDFPPEASTTTAQAQGTRAPLGIGVTGTGFSSQGAGGDAASAPAEESATKMMPAVIVSVVTLLLAAGMGFGALRLLKKSKA